VQDLITQYLRAAASDETKNYTDLTLENYRHQLTQFLKLLTAHLRREPTAADYTLENLTMLDNARKNAGRRPRTRYASVTALRQFGDWLVLHGHVESNPARLIKYPKLDKPVRRMAKEADVIALLDGCDRLKGSVRQVFARAVLSTFFYTGVRKGELLALTTDDIDMRENKLTVRKGKGRKFREIPINRDLHLALEDWLRIRQSVLPVKHLWMITNNRPLSEYTLQSLLMDVKTAAKLTHVSLTPHTFRRYFATMLQRRGVALPTIQYLLGHEDINTTLGYLQTDDDQIAAAVELVVPGRLTPDNPLMQQIKREGRGRRQNLRRG
jgi:site-specific recombinase XerD